MTRLRILLDQKTLTEEERRELRQLFLAMAVHETQLQDETPSPLGGKLYIMTREMLKWRRSLNRRRLQGWRGQFVVEAILEVMTIGVLTYAVACLIDLYR
jgi:hypothetical protein